MADVDQVDDSNLADNLDTIKVCVRIRPPDEEEPASWMWDRQTVTMVRPSRRNSTKGGNDEPMYDMGLPAYSFDYLFHPEDDNAQIYTDLGRTIVTKALQGYHGCIFTYGQTASGKTFTMNGTAKSPGLIPHASFDAFDIMEAMKDRVFSVKLAYLELYREQVLDLLNPDSRASEAIKIQYDPKLGTVIQGLIEEEVQNPQQVMMLLQRGESLRHVGATDMNEKSSRAHTIFRLLIESRSVDPSDQIIRKSTLNLIDLAGSENARMTNAVGDRAKEAKFINQSLLTLSTIIQRLGEVRGGGHLPFRDSKLTRILQDPLSGNTVIAIICTISTSQRCADETNNTLKFAARAKKITLAPAAINEQMDDKSLLRHYESEIFSLKNMVNDLIGKLQAVAPGTVLPDVAMQSIGASAGGTVGPYIKSAVMKLIGKMETYLAKANNPATSTADELKQHQADLDSTLADIKEKLASTEAIDTSDTGSMLSPSTKSQGGDDMLQLELKLRVADSRYLIEELKKKERHVERANAEMFDQERIIRRMMATISKLGGNPDDLVELDEPFNDNSSTA